MMRHCAAAGLVLALSGTAVAQEAEEETRFVLIGEVAPRHARDIAANNWSIGAEAMDRNFNTYAAWREYLGPLGAKHARLQSGWARTDRGDGTYDFAWLDTVVDDMNAQGVRPWISLSYGNPAYPGGGTAQRDSDLPTGEARTAWLAYVAAAVTRYRDKVDLWEIWNEPDIGTRTDGRTFGLFAAETARTIRAADPEAEITLAGFTGRVLGDEGSGRPFARDALTAFVETVGRGAADYVTYHPYSLNPDAPQADVQRFAQMVRTIDPGLELRQGENGAPSINQSLFASRNVWWTEESQAKYMLRRMLGDAGHGIWTSVFTLTDLHYSTQTENTAAFNRRGGPPAQVAMNTKGLLETRRYAEDDRDDRTVVRTKMGYRAMQTITSIFDARLAAVPGACTTSDPAVVAYGFRRDDGAAVVAAWRASDRPGARPEHQDVDVRCPELAFSDETVFVDPLTSTVYLRPDLVAAEGDGVVLNALPVYDSPVLVADRSLVEIW